MAAKTTGIVVESEIAIGLKTVPKITEPIRLTVIGNLPSYLSRGTLYRNGPGRFEAVHADGSMYKKSHWFHGFALVHAFTVDAVANTVHYRSRFTSESVIRAFVEYSFARADPCRSLLDKFFQLWTKRPVDRVTGKVPANCGVTIETVPGKGAVVARTDVAADLVLEPDMLEVYHFFNFSQLSKELSGALSSSHGHYDKETGDFLNFNFDLGAKCLVEYNVFRIAKTGNIEMLASFKERPYYIHSFFTRPNFVVMCLWPMHINALRLFFGKSLMDAMKFRKNSRTKFIVISRIYRRVVATYDTPSFFCFHTINAFERDDSIQIDLCKYKDATVLDHLPLHHMVSETVQAESIVSRFSLEGFSSAIAGGAKSTLPAIERVISTLPLEMPCVHPDFLRKDYKFVYGAASTDGKIFNQLTKLDVSCGKIQTWHGNKGVVGEPIFVPDPDGNAEDDGMLLVVVLDCVKKNSDMIVVNAKTMTEIARAYVPQVVPLGAHGNFNID